MLSRHAAQQALRWCMIYPAVLSPFTRFFSHACTQTHRSCSRMTHQQITGELFCETHSLTCGRYGLLQHILLSLSIYVCSSGTLLVSSHPLLHPPCLFVPIYRVVGVAGRYTHFCQHPNAIGEFDRLVQHVLPLHCSLGYGEDITALQLVAGRVCEREVTH